MSGAAARTTASPQNNPATMPLETRGECDVYWMMEGKSACEPGCRARNWHWFQKYCTLSGKKTNEAVDPDDLKSVDLDGKQTHVRDGLVRMCAAHVEMLRPLHPFVDVPPGKLSVPAEFAVLRNAFIRYHEAKRSGQEVAGLYGLEWDHLREGIVSQPSHVVWATTEMPTSITSRLACPDHLVVQQFRNKEAEMAHKEAQIAHIEHQSLLKSMRLSVLEDKVKRARTEGASGATAQATSIETVSVGTQTDPVVSRPEAPGAMYLVLYRQRVAGLYECMVAAHVRASHMIGATVVQLMPNEDVGVDDEDDDLDAMLTHVEATMDTGTEADPFREF